jgi:hypothetical protein
MEIAVNKAPSRETRKGTAGTGGAKAGYTANR